jgi:hypothetical protein
VVFFTFFLSGVYLIFFDIPVFCQFICLKITWKMLSKEFQTECGSESTSKDFLKAACVAAPRHLQQYLYLSYTLGSSLSRSFPIAVFMWGFMNNPQE